jgi:uroporphyrinogen III methyltransferase/synthase
MKKAQNGGMSGHVYLIGAGPGDPGLLTLRGAQLLQRCDVVLFDGLSNTQLLEHAPQAEQICVGKHGQTRIWRQAEVIAEMLRHARAGKRVARLKGGDPAVFARTAEEIQALSAAGIPFEIVPGITAALAAGSFAGIPITHRGLASAVALVTGHEEPDKNEPAVDWRALAVFPGTLVVYMGITTAPVWSAALISAGKSPQTPVAIVRRCSLPDQQTIHCRLDQVAAQIDRLLIRPPAIIIIGPVTELADTMQWVQHRPLHGQTILVTRPADQAESLAAPLRELGAQVLVQPAIEISAPADWTEIDAVIATLQQFDAVVFCSHNGVRHFLDRMLHLGADARRFSHAVVAVIGSKTAETLRQYSIHADLVPTDFRAESLADQMRPTVTGKRILIVRASRGRDVLAPSLRAAGADVREVVAYTHQDCSRADPKIFELMQAGKVDWVTVTSSASGASLVNSFGPSLKRAKLATIGELTSQTLIELGYPVSAQAAESTIESLIAAIESKQKL